MIKIELELTKEESEYLIIELDCILRSYKRDYNGQRYDNEDMGNAFNKVFKALTGSSHKRWLAINSTINS